MDCAILLAFWEGVFNPHCCISRNYCPLFFICGSQFEIGTICATKEQKMLDFLYAFIDRPWVENVELKRSIGQVFLKFLSLLDDWKCFPSLFSIRFKRCSWSIFAILNCIFALYEQVTRQSWTSKRHGIGLRNTSQFNTEVKFWNVLMI